MAKLVATDLAESPSLKDGCFNLLQSHWPISSVLRNISLSQHPKNHLLLVDGTTVIAHAFLKINHGDATTATVVSVIVAENYRRQRIGQQLMQLVEKVCRETKIHNLFLKTTNQGYTLCERNNDKNCHAISHNISILEKMIRMKAGGNKSNNTNIVEDSQGGDSGSWMKKSFLC